VKITDELYPNEIVDEAVSIASPYVAAVTVLKNVVFDVYTGVPTMDTLFEATESSDNPGGKLDEPNDTCVPTGVVSGVITSNVG
jgi:hypothetical protein